MSLAGTIRKTVRKHAEGSLTLAEGFYDLDLWVSCGNYAMNRLLSGSYYKGFPFARSTAIAGESGSGKSLVAATGAANAQKEHDALVVWVDSEHASKEEWLQRLGVDTSEEKFVYLNAGTIEDAKKIIADVATAVRKAPENKRQPVYIVFDSYNQLMTGRDWENALAGVQGGDQGQSAKQKKEFVSGVTTLIGRLPIAVVGMVHSMASTDKYNPDEVITGGRGVQYLASLVLLFSKMKLKAQDVEGSYTDEDDDGKKVVGIRCRASVYKSRFAKPHEKVTVQIPWPHGLDPYSGLLDHMLEYGEIYQPGIGWFAYKTIDGKETKFRRKEFREHADAIMKASESNQLVKTDKPTKEAQDEE